MICAILRKPAEYHKYEPIVRSGSFFYSLLQEGEYNSWLYDEWRSGDLSVDLYGHEPRFQ